MRRVRSADGIRLAVTEAGPTSAPTVVCVHGYPDNATLWDPVTQRLADRWHVVAYDVRGAGQSDTPADLDGYHLDRLTDDLLAVIDAVSPQRPVHLLAHDWGSVQAWHAVADERLRGRIASFTSMSGPSLDHAGVWLRSCRTPRQLGERINQLAHSTYIGLFQLPALPEVLWRSGLAGRLLTRLDRSAERPDVSDAVNGLALYRRNMVSRLRRPRPRAVDVPVQVLVPTRDNYVGDGLQTQINDWVDDLRVRYVSSGHWLPRQRPDVLARCTSELIEHTEHGTEAGALRRARARQRTAGRFAGDLVVVTGAGNGIGRATALAFAAEGAELALCDVDGDAVEATAARARSFGATANASIVDVADPDAVTGFAEQVGTPDVVVNNAGIGVAGSFVDTELADWQRVMDVNVWGVVHCCRAFATRMIDRGEGGRIVNVASAAAYLPSRMLPAYATTKAAVLMLSQSLRAELSEHDVGVTAVCPGFVHTNITSTARFAGLDSDEQQRRRHATTEAYRRRNYPPEKVAAHILRATQENRAVAPVTAEARIGLALSRWTPPVIRKLAELEITPK